MKILFKDVEPGDEFNFDEIKYGKLIEDAVEVRYLPSPSPTRIGNAIYLSSKNRFNLCYFDSECEVEAEEK